MSEARAYASTNANVVSPPPLSDSEYNALKQVAINDGRVNAIVRGRPYNIMSYDFVSNANDNPVVWQPEIHINFANKTQITSVLSLKQDPSTSSVDKVLTFPMLPPAQSVGGDTNHGFAINYYTGGSVTNGLKMLTSLPTVAGTSSVNLYWGVNALESNAVESNSCNAAHFADAYFAQSGLAWVTNGFIVWADTATSCATQVTSVGGSSGNSMDFRVYVDTSNNWVMYGKNLSNGQQFIKTRAGVNFLAMKTNNYNTSVFMESQSSTVHGNQISNPAATAQRSGDKGVSWSNWESAARNDQSCTNVNHTYPYSSTLEVISGNLSGGGTAT